MFWLVFVVLAFITGLVRGRWWTFGAWPLLALGLGAVAEARLPRTYDSPGLALAIAAWAAGACALAWLLGRGFSALQSWAQRRR